MFGVQVAVLCFACTVAGIMLLTAPLWMRALAALGNTVWRQVSVADREVMIPPPSDKIIEGEFREADE